MGFKEVMNINIEPNPRTGGMAPTMNYANKEQLRTSFDELQNMMQGEDDDDPEYLLDELRDSAAAHSNDLMDDDHGQPTSRSEKAL